MNVNEYVKGYEFRGESDYTPNDREKTLIEDAIAGYLSHCTAPVAEVWRVLTERFGVERDHVSPAEADTAMAALLSATSPAAENVGTAEGWQPRIGDAGVTAEGVEYVVAPKEPSATMLQAVVDANRSESGLTIKIGFECAAAGLAYRAMTSPAALTPSGRGGQHE